MASQANPYLFIDDTTFLDNQEREVRGVFDAFHARLMFVPEWMARKLAHDGDFLDSNPNAAEAMQAAGLAVADAASLICTAHERMAEAAKDLRHPIFVLLPTTYCNMGCEYCGQEHSKGAIGPGHRDRIVERIKHAVTAPETQVVSVRWFGGEPLMGFATLRDLSRKILKDVDEVGVEYRSNIVTNGALLDERKMRTLVEDCRVTEFHITLDGPAEIHDVHRPLKNGKRSFERLTGFLSRALANPAYADINVVLRTNVDIENCEYVSDYLREMARRGFANRPNVTFSLVPVHPWGNDVSARQLEMRRYAEREAEWLDLMNELGLRQVLLPTAPKAQTCGATNAASEVISATGGVFSCTEHPLVPEHERESVLASLSDLAATARRPVGEFDSWAEEVRSGAVPCTKCWMLPVCGGHCPKSWHEGQAACPSSKFNMDARIQIAARNRGMRAVASHGQIRAEV